MTAPEPAYLQEEEPASSSLFADPHPIAKRIASLVSNEDAPILADYLQTIDAIRQSDRSPLEKLKAALHASKESKPALRIAKTALKAGKVILWDSTSLPVKLGLLGVIGSLTVFGGEAGAGIVALGSGFGLPLWVLFGGGASVVGVLINELRAKVSATAVLVREGGVGE